MITAPDFSKKQIVFVMCSEGEKFCVRNDNLVVMDKDETIKLQCTFYRLFMVNIVGNCTLTSVLLQKAKKHGFFIALYSQGLRLHQLIGSAKEGNTILKKKQYNYDDSLLAQRLVKNKIASEYILLHNMREKEEELKQAEEKIKALYYETGLTIDSQSLLAYEGIAAKTYFNAYFSDFGWKGRKPRIKNDYLNSSLDIGYTMLFNYLDAIISSFGFDTYVGVYHKEFYMRKSLVCDLVEPFRYLIDKSVRKSVNLKQLTENDFELENGQYRLKWKSSKKVVAVFMDPIIKNKDLIFKYIQSYYRCFVKELSIDEYPFVIEGEIIHGSYKL